MSLPQPYELFDVHYNDSDEDISKAFAYISGLGNGSALRTIIEKSFSTEPV